MADTKGQDASTRGRLKEVGLAVAVAALSGAATSYVSIPAALARFEEHLRQSDVIVEAHAQRLQQLERDRMGSESDTKAQLASLNARQNADDTNRIELNARLARIEDTQAKILTAVQRR